MVHKKCQFSNCSDLIAYQYTLTQYVPSTYWTLRLRIIYLIYLLLLVVLFGCILDNGSWISEKILEYIYIKRNLYLLNHFFWCSSWTRIHTNIGITFLMFFSLCFFINKNCLGLIFFLLNCMN